MLYLPPRYAHDGIALDPCTTYSIGFRAPAHQEVAEAFLDWLRDSVSAPGRYADPGIRATSRPRASTRRPFVGSPSRWRASAGAARRRTLRRPLLSEPKPHVTFEPPAPTTLRAFAARARRAGVRLDLRTQLLYDGRGFYLNGAEVAASRVVRAPLQRLADARALDAAALRRAPAELPAVLHDWYAHGYLEFADD
jgi:50S ribosomal protein L16 3-hydroxylase